MRAKNKTGKDFKTASSVYIKISRKAKEGRASSSRSLKKASIFSGSVLSITVSYLLNSHYW